MKENKFKVGDTVQRIAQAGTHGHKRPGVPFKVIRVAYDGTIRDDQGNYGHDPANLELVQAAEPVTNNTYTLW